MEPSIAEQIIDLAGDNSRVDAQVILDTCKVLHITKDQRKFAELLVNGFQKTAAYRVVWPDQPDGVGLRARASKLAKTQKIQKLTALLRGQSPAEALPGDQEEVLRLLWSQARSQDPNVSHRAVAKLDAIHDRDRESRLREAEAHKYREPQQILDEIATLGGHGVLIALSLAQRHHLPYKPPPSVEIPSIEALAALLHFPIDAAIRLASIKEKPDGDNPF